MFIKNDAPDTKENHRHRKIEKYISIVISDKFHSC